MVYTGQLVVEYGSEIKEITMRQNMGETRTAKGIFMEKSFGRSRSVRIVLRWISRWN
jgi:hypothetical protein